MDDKSLSATIEQSQKSSGTLQIDGDPISPCEFHELSHARLILQNLVALRQIPMFDDISQALKYISGRLTDETRLKHSPANVFLENLSMLSSHSIGSQIYGADPNLLIGHDDGEHDIMRDVYLSLDDEDRTSNESTVIPILKEKGLSYNYTPSANIGRSSNIDQSISINNISLDSQAADISNGKLTRCTDTVDSLSEQTRLAIEKEICAIKSSRVLLFVITNKCRGLSIMVPASHFMALFRNNVVLCVQYLEEPCSIGGETLTKSAINDYNRGRVYLCDYANKSEVPVFSTIREAIECCSRKCRYNNKG